MALSVPSKRGLLISSILYVVALVAIAIAGATRSFVLLVPAAIGLFVAAVVAAVTVRRIREAQPNPELPGMQRLVVPLVLAIAGIGLGAFLFERGTDGVALSFFCGGLITLGHFLGEWRSRQALAPWRGLAWLAACAIGFFASLAEAINNPFPALFGLCAAILLTPIGLTLLSEDVTRRYLTNTGRRVLVLLCGLLVVVAGTFWLNSTRMSAFYVRLAVIVLFVLIIAIASATQGDLLLVAVLIVLVVTALPEGIDPSDDAALVPAPVTSSSVKPDDRILVALGDSFMSGEGADEFYTGTNERGRNECRRASSAYARRVIDHAASTPFGDRVAFYACSAATGSNVLLEGGDPQYFDEPVGGPEQTQLQQLEALLKAGARPSLVIVSVGGNDAGFGAIARACLAPRSCVMRGQIWLDGLRAAEGEIGSAYDAIQTLVTDEVPVLVVPYPQPINAAKEKCGYSMLEPKEHEFLHGFVLELNKIVQKEAKGHRFHYLKAMETAFDPPRSMRICDPGTAGSRRGVNFIALDRVSGLREEVVNPTSWVHGSLHPNEHGHEVMAQVLAEWMKANPNPTARSKTSKLKEYPVKSLQEIMGTDFTENYCLKPGYVEARCDLSSNDWALTEVVRFLKEIVSPLIVLVFGLWLICLSLLSWTRRFWRRRADEFARILGYPLPPDPDQE